MLVSPHVWFGALSTSLLNITRLKGTLLFPTKERHLLYKYLAHTKNNTSEIPHNTQGTLLTPLEKNESEQTRMTCVWR